MASPNYGYEKRQKELAKKRKKEDKLKRKAELKTGVGGAVEGAGEDGVDEAGLPPALPPVQGTA